MPIIQKGCRMLTGTNSFAVARMMRPMTTDLVVAAAI